MTEGVPRQVFFSITRSELGFWVEYDLGRGLHSSGPFKQRKDAIKYGERKGWSFLDYSSRGTKG
jgi:hypothetical protein